MDGKVKIDRNFITLNYIKQYGSFFFKFKLRQSHSPLDAKINNILNKYGTEPDPYRDTLNRQVYEFEERSNKKR